MTAAGRRIPAALPKLAGGGMEVVVSSLLGIGALLGFWHLLSLALETSAELAAFKDMAPVPALGALLDMVADGSLAANLQASLGRVGAGLLLATLAGVLTGIAVGSLGRLRALTHVPFQFLRMVSPLAWMPVAVIAFDTWNGAIVFIVAMAAVWPILYSVAGAIRKLNPDWFELAGNLGAGRRAVVMDFIVPAIAQDILAGLRLALGVAWIVLVPAELLGVTSGLGYALNDARDALEYDRLAAMVLAIGLVGFVLDSLLHLLVKRWSWHAIS